MLTVVSGVPIRNHSPQHWDNNAITWLALVIKVTSRHQNWRNVSWGDVVGWTILTSTIILFTPFWLFEIWFGILFGRGTVFVDRRLRYLLRLECSGRKSWRRMPKTDYVDLIFCKMYLQTRPSTHFLFIESGQHQRIQFQIVDQQRKYFDVSFQTNVSKSGNSKRHYEHKIYRIRLSF